MKIEAIIERASDGTYSIYHNGSDALGFLITGTGATLEDSKRDFLQGYEAIKEVELENGVEIDNIEWIWVYDIASFIKEYSYAFTLSGLAKITGVSQGVLSHYANGTSHPSKRTREKIKAAVTKFANTLSSVQLV